MNNVRVGMTGLSYWIDFCSDFGHKYINSSHNHSKENLVSFPIRIFNFLEPEAHHIASFFRDIYSDFGVKQFFKNEGKNTYIISF